MPTLPPPPLKAMILAAGRGERMRPLTDSTPKPLLPVAGRPMIEWHLRALAAAGVRQVVINTAWLEDQFPAALGDGSRWGLQIHYSHEGRDHDGALETAGGIATALPWLGDCFWLVSGDIVAPGFAFDAGQAAQFADADDDAHLWLVPNPDFHAEGDFALAAGRVMRPPAGQLRPLTYANLALVRRRLVAGLPPGRRAPLGPLLFDSAAAGRLGGEMLAGAWHNLGTPAQWSALQPPAAAPRLPAASGPLPAGLAALAAALLLAAWPVPGDAAPPAKTAASAAAMALAVAAASAANPASRRFTYQGLPPVLAGQAVSEAESALGQALKPEAAPAARAGAAAAAPPRPARACSYSVAASQPGLRYAISAGTIARVETRDSRYRTVSGVQVGDSLARAEKAYGRRMTSQPHPYFDQGRVLTVTSPDKRHALVMESNDQGRIVTLRSGSLPEVIGLEGC